MILIRPVTECRLLLVLVVAQMLAFAGPSWAQEAVPSWKFQQDDVFAVTLNQSTKIKSQVDQRVKDVDNQLTLNMTWKVNSISESGSANVEMTIVSVQMKMESMPNGVGKSIDIDTTSEEKKKGAEAELLKQLEPLIGSVVEIEITPRGEVKNVVIPEATLVSLREAPGSMKLRTLLTSEGITDLFGQSVVVLPDDLKENQPWSVTNPLETGFGKFSRTHTYTWKSNRNVGDNTFADFEFKTTIEPVAESQNSDSKLTQFSGGGSLVFDIGGGHFASSKSTNDMTTQQQYREKTITTTVSTVVEMQIKKQ